ncbi:hypothetical protein ABW21_db0209694 [Orbilia brochopaga]|nr:hypothetical protein ABW21_db0209694 [Drechslerella brochopaga]
MISCMHDHMSRSIKSCIGDDYKMACDIASKLYEECYRKDKNKSQYGLTRGCRTCTSVTDGPPSPRNSPTGSRVGSFRVFQGRMRVSRYITIWLKQGCLGSQQFKGKIATFLNCDNPIGHVALYRTIFCRESITGDIDRSFGVRARTL